MVKEGVINNNKDCCCCYCCCSPRGLKYEDNLNFDHTGYSNHTNAMHRLYHFFPRPVGQKFRLYYPGMMNILATLFAKKQPLILQVILLN